MRGSCHDPSAVARNTRRVHQPNCPRNSPPAQPEQQRSARGPREGPRPVRHHEPREQRRSLAVVRRRDRVVNRHREQRGRSPRAEHEGQREAGAPSRRDALARHRQRDREQQLCAHQRQHDPRDSLGVRPMKRRELRRSDGREQRVVNELNRPDQADQRARDSEVRSKQHRERSRQSTVRLVLAAAMPRSAQALLCAVTQSNRATKGIAEALEAVA